MLAVRGQKKMPTSLPLTLLIAWVLFLGFLGTHAQHASRFGGESQGFLLALYLSVILGWLVGLGLLIYYYMQVAWYWPIALLICGTIVAGLLFAVLDGLFGRLTISFLAFIGWPATAAWAFFIVRGLAP